MTYEQWTSELVSNLAKHMNLAGWRIDVDWSDEEPEELETGFDNTYAKIEVDNTYMSASIVYMKAAELDFADGNTQRIVMATVHELFHIFLNPFQEAMYPFLSLTTADAFMQKIEQQTQRLTMIYLKTLPTELIPEV